MHSECGDRKCFALAPMGRGIAILTWAIPLGTGTILVVASLYMPPLWRWAFVFGLLGSVALVLLFLWGFYRPKSFELSAEGLRIIWPWRSKLIPAEQLLSARMISRGEVGWPMRLFGAGGFMGGFGLFWSKKIGKFDLYASRFDTFVLVQRRGHRPLLITPDRPEVFVETAGHTIGGTA